jgi:rfaE bifunctional protein kinase chain/domain
LKETNRKIIVADDINRLFDDFSQQHVMVVGDVMIDSYVFGAVDRISPEAPVPVVAVKQRINRLGGAANVALNIHALDAHPVLVSVIGADQRGNDFMELLQKEHLISEGIIRSIQRPTTTKFRIIGNKVQMLRVDEETTDDISTDEETLLVQKVEQLLQNYPIKVMVLQDYNKGVLTENLILQLVALSKKYHVKVAVDPKKKHFLAYKGVSLFKPNLKELKEGLDLGFQPETIPEIKAAVHQLQQILNADMVMATLSEKGVLVSEKNIEGSPTYHHLEAHLRSITDVSGAGDTVISVAALCLSLEVETFWLAEMANLAGGLVCEEIGVVPVNKNKLRAEVFRIWKRNQTETE